eukprot:6427562-Amphidinium_carterae.1
MATLSIVKENCAPQRSDEDMKARQNNTLDTTRPPEQNRIKGVANHKPKYNGTTRTTSGDQHYWQ